MAYEKYTIKQFMSAMFEDDYSVISKDELDVVYIEYVDTAELYHTDDFEKVSYIQFLTNHVNTIRLAIDLQRRFVNDFNYCYSEGLELFKKLGHLLKWVDRENFLKQLDAVEMREKKYVSKLEQSIKELMDARKKNKKPAEDIPKKERRGSFIRTLNSLRKEGWQIDNDKHTVEDLAWMIKDQKEIK